MKGLLFLIIGPSGVGKNTLIIHLLQQRSDIHFIPSYSSRPIRSGESEGNPYHFVTSADFEQMIHENAFLEWKAVHGYYYGVARKAVENSLVAGHYSITDIEVLGAMDVIDAFPLNCVSVYIDVPSQEALVQRMRARGPVNDEDLRKRLARVAWEGKYKEHFDYAFCNVSVEDSVNCLSHIVDLRVELQNYAKSCPSRVSPRKPLHYLVLVLVLNENGELLLLRQKMNRCEMGRFCQVCVTHVLACESPGDAVQRFFAMRCLSLRNGGDIASSMRYKGNYMLHLQSHDHFVWAFQCEVEGADVLVDSEDYLFEWRAREDLPRVLSPENLSCVQSFLDARA